MDDNNVTEYLATHSLLSDLDLVVHHKDIQQLTTTVINTASLLNSASMCN